jgi:hypothetical protein
MKKFILILMASASIFSASKQDAQQMSLEIFEQIEPQFTEGLSQDEIQASADTLAASPEAEKSNTAHAVVRALKQYKVFKKNNPQVVKAYKELAKNLVGSHSSENIMTRLSSPNLNFGLAVTCSGSGAMGSGLDGEFEGKGGLQSNWIKELINFGFIGVMGQYAYDCYTKPNEQKKSEREYKVDYFLMGVGLDVMVAELSYLMCALDTEKESKSKYYNIAIQASASAIVGPSVSVAIGENGICLQVGGKLGIGAEVGAGILRMQNM